MDRFGGDKKQIPFYIGTYNFYPTYAGVGIQKNAVINISYSYYETILPFHVHYFQTFQLEVDDIARRLWEAGIADVLIRRFIPLKYLKNEKIEVELVPFGVCYHNS